MESGRKAGTFVAAARELGVFEGVERGGNIGESLLLEFAAPEKRAK